MKSPEKCPSCDGVLRSNFLDQGLKISRIEKICDLHLNHKFKSYEYDKTNEIFAIEIEIDKESRVHALFQLTTKQIMIFKGRKLVARDSLKLPYFEPDLENYNKIINKIKTYIMMS